MKVSGYAFLYEYKATLVRVVDGDTLILLVDLGFKVHKEVTVRLARIDAPEIKSIEGKASKTFLENKLKEGLLIHLTSKGIDGYGRSIGEITLLGITPTGINLSNYLVENKQAIHKTY